MYTDIQDFALSFIISHFSNENFIFTEYWMEYY